jgi:hypothetical protein
LTCGFGSYFCRFLVLTLGTTIDVSDADFRAAWGEGVNLVAVSGWHRLSLNNGGDTIGLWPNFSDYNGDHVEQAKAAVSLSFDSSGEWPRANNSASIYLTNLDADPNNGRQWALSVPGSDTPAGISYRSREAGGNSGNDVGSPNAVRPIPTATATPTADGGPQTATPTTTPTPTATTDDGPPTATPTPATPTQTPTVTFTPTWTPTRYAPIAVDDIAVTDEDTPIELDLLANDTDEAGSPLRLVAIGHVEAGAVSAETGGKVLYVPRPDHHGAVQFTYAIRNESGGQDAATVEIMINPVNDAPVLTPVNHQSGAIGDEILLVIQAYDVDGDTVSYSAEGLPPGLILDRTTGQISGILWQGGNYGVTITASDGELSASQSFRWVVDAPGGQANWTAIFLPLVTHAEPLPDLMAEIRLDPENLVFAAGEEATILVTIANRGNAHSGGFWVDLHINPDEAPQEPPAPWHQTCSLSPCYGMTWYVATLPAGQQIELSSDRPLAGYSIWNGSFAPGTTDLYVVVDSWGSTTGAVSEINEENNIVSLHGLRVEGEAVRDGEKVPDLPPRPPLSNQ